MTEEEPNSNTEDKEITKKNSKIILLSSILILLWSISYGILVIRESLLRSTIISLNTISNLILDALIVIVIGLIFVFFYFLSEFFIRLSLDRKAFVKIEQCIFHYRESGDFGQFVKDVIHFDVVKGIEGESPIPKSEVFAILSLGIYYIINFFGFAIMTEIIFSSISTTEFRIIVLDQDNLVLLPIIASSMVIGGKVSSLYYDYTKEYANMLAETLYIFLLLGILSSLFGGQIHTFIDEIPLEHGLPIYFSILIYLALIPVALEVIKWFLYMKQPDKS